MAYQLNKDTKILLVLLAVVVLCSAKLFKDYLYRNRYVEGMTLVSQENSDQLRRPDADPATTVNITFTVKLAMELTTSQTLRIAWTTLPSGVTLPSTAANYTATVSGSGYTISPPSSAVAAAGPATFSSPNKNVPSGTIIKIVVTGVTIATDTKASTDNITFTITAGTDTTTTIVKILPKIGTASTYTATGGSSSVAEIKAAITKINERIDAIPEKSSDAAIAEIETLEKVRSAMISLLASTY